MKQHEKDSKASCQLVFDSTRSIIMPTNGSERAAIISVGQRPTEQEQSRAQALKARNPIPVKHRIPPFRGVAGGAIPFDRALPYPIDFALSEQ